MQRSTQDHTAFLITENEIKVTNLQDEIQRLGDKLDRANKSLEIKTSELKKLHQEFEDYMKENDLKISALEQKLKEQAALFRDVMSQAFTQLTERLSIDYENIQNNFKIFSKSTSDLIELEFLNPPFLDEESANNM
uniref:SJCHGC08878 protein n=1 Tax=Schistosoma japonicum TaxID=6182 RepID=Q5DB22_SCHJA|nr:SJCHGC08878 protein [Schistosoma japonicum]